MVTRAPTLENRREVRLQCDDAIRWKHPGKPEDFKGWTIDRSPSGFGFMAKSEQAPRVGADVTLRVDRCDEVVAAVVAARGELGVAGELQTNPLEHLLGFDFGHVGHGGLSLGTGIDRY